MLQNAKAEIEEQWQLCEGCQLWKICKWSSVYKVGNRRSTRETAKA